MPAASASIRSGGSSCPCAAPAAREMLSFISVPPRSFAPACRQAAAPASRASPRTPGCWASRGAARAAPPHASGAPRATSVPDAALPAPVERRFHVHEGQRHEFRHASGLLLQVACSRWRAQCRGASRCPYMMVAVVGKPMRCAAAMTLSHCTVLSLSGQISRGSRRRGSRPRCPAGRRPRILQPFQELRREAERAAPCVTSSGEKACTWIRDRLFTACSSSDRSRPCSPGECRPAGRLPWRRAAMPRGAPPDLVK